MEKPFVAGTLCNLLATRDFPVRGYEPEYDELATGEEDTTRGHRPNEIERILDYTAVAAVCFLVCAEFMLLAVFLA